MSAKEKIELLLSEAEKEKANYISLFGREVAVTKIAAYREVLAILEADEQAKITLRAEYKKCMDDVTGNTQTNPD